MIGRLEGRLLRLDPGSVIVDVGGVGYRVATTLRSVTELVPDETVVLWIHTWVREDAIVLFGFPELAELAAFERLIGVAGVGPRTALAVLSGLPPDELAAAVEAGDLVRLQRVPGIGRKTAERILLELRGRFEVTGAAATATPDLRGDATSALINLGYSERDARRAVDGVLADAADSELGEVLRLALQHLNR